MTALEKFLALGGQIHATFPPILTRRFDYEATHYWAEDSETGGELTIGSGATKEEAAEEALEWIYDHELL